MYKLLSLFLLSAAVVVPAASADALSAPPDPEPSTFTLEIGGDFDSLLFVDGSTPVVEVVDDNVVKQAASSSTVTEDPDGEWSIRVDVEETITGDYYDGWMYVYRTLNYVYELTDLTRSGNPTTLGSELISASYSGSLDDGAWVGTSYIPASEAVIAAGALESEALLAATDLKRSDETGVVTGTVTEGEAYNSTYDPDDVHYENYDFEYDYSYPEDYSDTNLFSNNINDAEVAGIVGGIIILTFGILAIVFFAVFMPLVLGLVFIVVLAWLVVRAYRHPADRSKKSGMTPRPKA